MPSGWNVKKELTHLINASAPLIFITASNTQEKQPPYWTAASYVGIFLSSRNVTIQVFSALLSLTSVFGMGTGGPSTSSTPTYFPHHFWRLVHYTTPFCKMQGFFQNINIQFVILIKNILIVLKLSYNLYFNWTYIL